MNYLTNLFGLEGKTALVTGGSGVLGGAMALGLAQAGAKVAILSRRPEAVAHVVQQLEKAGCESLALTADVLDAGQLTNARETLLERWGKLDILVNAAGGNVPAATIAEGSSFFDMPLDAFRQVLDLNLLGSVLPSQIFGAAMAQNEPSAGCIINVSSMASQRVISRVVGYSAAKGAVENFTRWLAVELARKYGAGLRVNAIAPGFFIGDQNRALLLNPNGSLTTRGQLIIDHTPAGRFGEPSELISTLVWLCSPGASFINGVVVPVDGGFSVFSGV
jgi:NAD(P)-dependent dehydrogenase (short-subunit alcohol dehydrogenase family)